MAIKGASARTVARMDSKQHKPLPQNMQRYLLDFKRDFVDRHFGASFKVCDKFWLITTLSKSKMPKFRTERGRRFGFWSNDSRKELTPLHSSWCAQPASHGAAKSRSHSANWLGSMLNSKLQTNVFSFMHSVDCVQLCRSSQSYFNIYSCETPLQNPGRTRPPPSLQLRGQAYVLARHFGNKN